MDVVLNYADIYAFNSIYSHFPETLQPYFSDPTNIIRQMVSLWWICFIGVNLAYFFFSFLAYHFLFDKTLVKHPKYLPNQIKKEISMSLVGFPWLATLSMPWFLGEVRGHSQLYHNVDDYGWPYLILTVGLFYIFTDFGIYWIHRAEHHPSVYWWLHKPHHTWKIATPFASFAFHPLVRSNF